MRKSQPNFAVGDVLSPRELTTMTGEPLPVPDPDHVVHLQLRRFVGCPICNLHLRSTVNRLGEIEAAGIREVVVFHSTEKELLKYASDLPLPVVGDPHKKLYREFGIESSLGAALHPAVWGPTIRAVSSSMWGAVRRRNHLAPVAPNGGSLGLPGDFLIAPDGTILALKYGEHAYDQWSVDELLELARAPRPEPAPRAEETAPSVES